MTYRTTTGNVINHSAPTNSQLTRQTPSLTASVITTDRNENWNENEIRAKRPRVITNGINLMQFKRLQILLHRTSDPIKHDHISVTRLVSISDRYAEETGKNFAMHPANEFSEKCCNSAQHTKTSDISSAFAVKNNNDK